ncbi:hypothetical protein ACK8HY_01500 [Sphingobacterium sp. NGMCC 1.201703]|uniref:hypothetical protein n=1 Tax=Sphingobacterium sp. NGMCC 1.201703 TaxID=3388657 RepID=UPI0039FCAA52
MANQILIKNTMQEMRNLSAEEIAGLQGTTTIYSGVKLLGYYKKGDTPRPIIYYLSTTEQGGEDGGSVIVVSGNKLVHHFTEGVDILYFGAYCDGLTNDLDAFYFANVYGGKYQKEVILSRDTLVQATGSRATMGGSSLRAINGAKLIVDGNVQINTTNVKRLHMTDLEIELRNNWGTNTTAHNCRTLFYSTGAKADRYIYYRNIICRAIVPEENGTYRAMGLIEESGIMGGEISNIITYNIHSSITTDRNVGGNLSLSKGLLITDCKFYNAASGVVNNTWNSYLQNIELINTQEQSANFVQKDIPTIPEPYGMDCVLSSGSFTTYTNIRAINPIERCIYVQASHVYAENLYSVNGDGFKFVGYDNDKLVENIRVKNTTWVITDEYADLRKFMSHTQLYYVKNIWIEDVKIINQSSASKALLKEFGSIRGYAENVYIKNVQHIGTPMAVGFMRMALPEEPVAGSWEVYKNINIENCSFSVYRNKVNGTILRTGSETGEVKNSWTGYTKADYIANGVNIINCSVDNSQRQDKSPYYYRGIKNFHAAGNTATSVLEHASGFIDPALAAELNKQSQSVSIQDTFKTNAIGLALVAVDGFRFKDQSTVTFQENGTNAQFFVTNQKDGLVSLCSLKSWRPSKTANSVLNIGDHNAIVTSKSANGQYIGEIKSGVLVNRLGDIAPVGSIAFNAQTKELSINSFDADRVIDIEVLLTADKSPSKVIPSLTMSAIINASGTTSAATALWGVSSYVDLMGAKKILYNGRFGNQGSRIAFYSNNGAAAFLSAYPQTDMVISNQEIAIPDGALYARFSCYDPQSNNFYLILKDENGDIIR